MSFLRILRDRWAWWLIPMLLTLAAAGGFFLLEPDPEPTMPLRYDLPE
ncbi:MAG: hypothetical protein AAGF12_28770 [Myxococcota bacterium]